MGSRPSPLGAVAKGAIAGTLGTAAMTGAQTLAYKIQDSEGSTTPAEVAKRIIKGVFGRDVPEEKTELLNNVMHWSYGTGWGVLYGLTQGSAQGSAMKAGLLFGTAVWGASLVELPAMGLAPPVWEYPLSSLAQDVGFHLVYGAATGVAFAAIDRRAEALD